VKRIARSEIGAPTIEFRPKTIGLELLTFRTRLCCTYSAFGSISSCCIYCAHRSWI